MPQIAKSGADHATRAAKETVQQTAGIVGETDRRSAEGTAELGALLVGLLNEQARHNLQAATAFGRAVHWSEVIQIQSHFVHASLERMHRLSSRYLELVQAVMRATASAARRQARQTA